MPLVNLKLGNKNNYSQIDDLFELDIAAVVTGASFPRHSVLLFSGNFPDVKCYIKLGANKDAAREEITHDMVQCATIIAGCEAFVDAKLAALGTMASPQGLVSIPLVKYYVVFKDGRQAILTTKLAESQLMIERVLF